MSTTDPIDQDTLASTLVRPRHKRVVAGVAEGLGAYLHVDPVIFRIGFIVLALAGGGGLALYGLAWLLIPEEGSRLSRGADLLDRLQRHDRVPIPAAIMAVLCGLLLLHGLDRPWRMGGPLLLVAVAGMAALTFSAASRSRDHRRWQRLGGAGSWWLWSAGATLVGLGFAELVAGWSWGWAITAVVATAGVVLAVAGRRWAGAAVLLAILGTTIGGAVWQRGIGDRQYQPDVTTTGYRSYHLGAGRLIVDLTVIRPTAGRPADVTASVGVGQVVILLPSGSTASVDGSAGVGDVSLPDGGSGGLGVRRSIAIGAGDGASTADGASAGGASSGAGAGAALRVHTKVGIGEVLVEAGGNQGSRG